MDDEKSYRAMARAINPYGDGTASGQIVSILKKYFNMPQ
jgi:UDP-N-acetylglucosamine 2-epimerase